MKKIVVVFSGIQILAAMAMSAQAEMAGVGPEMKEVVPVFYSFDKATDVGTWDYSDWGGVQLTDGQYGVWPYSDDLGNGPAYEWVGWRYPSVNIDFDFGVSTEINQINIGSTQDHTGDVVLPSVTIYSSDDNSSWSMLGSEQVPESSLNDATYYTYEFSGLSAAAQYFRVNLSFSDDGPWSFSDEIDFYQTAVPEPASFILFGIGVLGFSAALRKNRKCRK